MSLVNSLIFFVTLMIFIIVYPFIYKKFNYWINQWYFWTILSIVWIGYSVYLYIGYVLLHGIFGEFSINSAPPTDPNKIISYYTIFGDATFTSMCAWIFCFMPWLLIFNPTRKIAQQLAPVGLIGGFIVLIAYFNGSYFNSAYEIFCGHNGTVMRHFLLVIICYALMFSTPPHIYKTNNKKNIRFINTDLCFTIVMYCIYITYVLIMSNLLRIWLPQDRLGYNCNGIYPHDWTQYGQFGMLGNLDWLYPLPMIIIWVLIILSNCVIVLIWNRIKKIPTFKYNPPKSYYFHNVQHSHKWWEL